MFECKVICDSIGKDTGKRLTTVCITYPRFIHSEILTHRDRARNSASSRAIPWPAMMARIENDPVVPIRWGSEQKGMQTGGEVSEKLQILAEAIWLQARDNAVQAAKLLANIGQTYYDMVHGRNPFEIEGMMFFGKSQIRRLEPLLPDLAVRREPTEEDEQLRQERVHKSLVNRITEPWMWITVVMTATEWKNFFRLRCHDDAEIHFQKIAGLIKHSLEVNQPTEIEIGDWHLPYVTAEDRDSLDIETLRKCSVARCARVSYLTHEGKRDIAKDLELFERLVTGSGFGHLSPFEHLAMCSDNPKIRSGPFRGWVQFRKTVPNECADED